MQHKPTESRGRERSESATRNGIVYTHEYDVQTSARRRAFVEASKRSPPVGIDCGKFQHLSPLNPADVHVVAEINRTGSMRENVTPLKTRLRKDKHLGRNGNVQLLQYRRQISLTLLVTMERHVIGIDAFLQSRYRIVNRGGVIPDRRDLNRFHAENRNGHRHHRHIC